MARSVRENRLCRSESHTILFSFFSSENGLFKVSDEWLSQVLNCHCYSADILVTNFMRSSPS